MKIRKARSVRSGSKHAYPFFWSLTRSKARIYLKSVAPPKYVCSKTNSINLTKAIAESLDIDWIVFWMGRFPIVALPATQFLPLN
jgi:hypothetical protein